MPDAGVPSVLHELVAAVDAGEPVVLATVVGTCHSVPRHAGSKMLVRPGGRHSGSVGGGAVEARVVADALEVLAREEPRLIHYALNGAGPGLGPCGGELTVYLEPHVPPPIIETMRGPRLGRVYWQGRAAPNTGTPAVIGGRGAERVLRAPAAGRARWRVSIGDVVDAGAVLGAVGDERVRAPFAGVVRGLIADGTPVAQGLKIGDIDPRADTDWREISDKALAVAGGVLEAILTWLSPRTGGRARSGSRPPGRDR